MGFSLPAAGATAFSYADEPSGTTTILNTERNADVPEGKYVYVPGEGTVAPTPSMQPLMVAQTSTNQAASTLSIDPSNQAQMNVLVENRFTGLNPANTKVNLYDYTSYKADGNDEQFSSSDPTNWLGTTSNPNINTGHALTFGNGMNNDMGYWNAGSGSGMGVFSGYTPGFQNIVAPTLGADGYPMLSEASASVQGGGTEYAACLLYTSPSPRD